MSTLFNLDLPLGHAANTVPDCVIDNFRMGGDDDDDDSFLSLCMGTKKRKKSLRCWTGIYYIFLRPSSI